MWKTSLESKIYSAKPWNNDSIRKSFSRTFTSIVL